MGEYYFRTSELSVGYGGKTLIHDIEISLKAGEILTLIGPNGSGKSTILKSITKHLETIKGDSFIADASIGQMSYKELSRKLAVVLTERIKGELLTCYDVVATGRYPYTNTLGLLSEEDREKVSAAMERVHALELADRDFTAISDGQRQRVLLARAICQEPEIIVLDEPTSFLDIRHKLELLSILRSMAREKGITVIMSLHEIDLAQKISDKVMCVKGETIAHFGKPEEIFREEIINELYGLNTYHLERSDCLTICHLERSAAESRDLRKESMHPQEISPLASLGRNDGACVISSEATEGSEVEISQQGSEAEGKPPLQYEVFPRSGQGEVAAKRPEGLTGSYNVLFGSVELPRPVGKPRVLVISSGGSGIPIFRKLQKEETPFMAGPLYKNDIDYLVAQALASEVIAEEAYRAISDEVYERALAAVEACEAVYLTDFPIGEQNGRIREIIEAARAAEKLKEI